MVAKIDSAEELIDQDIMNDAEVKHLIAADELYLSERGKLDDKWLGRYGDVLDVAVKRLASEEEED